MQSPSTNIDRVWSTDGTYCNVLAPNQFILDTEIYGETDFPMLVSEPVLEAILVYDNLKDSVINTTLYFLMSMDTLPSVLHYASNEAHKWYWFIRSLQHKYFSVCSSSSV
jgi:hypothetical protein